MNEVDSTPEKLCRVAVTEDEELWEWFRCPHCNCRKFYRKDTSENAVYVRLRCINCNTETKIKIGSKAEKKRRNNRRRCERKKNHEDG